MFCIGDSQDLGSEVGQMQAKFWQHPSHKLNPAHTKWARWCPNNHQSSSYPYIEGWWYGLAGYWLVLWMETVRIWAQKLGKCKPSNFDNIPATNPTQRIPNGPDDTLLTTINHHHMGASKDDGMD
jgi:hypothetical protein